MTRHNTKKLRAVFLAALMVLWVFAGTVALAGSAAALEDVDSDAEFDNPTNVDGQTFYQGQEVAVNVSTTGVSSGDTVQVRRITNRNDQGEPTNTGLSTSATVQTDANGSEYILIRTENLEANDFVLKEDGGQFLNTSDGLFTASLSSGDAATFEITTQSLSVEFDDDEVRSDESTDITIESNRGGYDLVVSADGLDEDDLENIFNDLEDAGVVSGITLDSEDEEITLQNVDAVIDEEEITFTEIDPDEYEFEFEADDTTAADNASIEVLEEVDADATFTESTFTDQRGDVVNVSLEVDGDTDEVDVTFGDQEDYGYEANATIEPNDDDQIVFQLNTFKAGNASGQVDDPVGDVFIEDEGDIVGAAESNELDRVLESGTYEISAEVDGEETDVAVVNLQERSLDGVTIGTAPDDESISELEDLEEGADEGWVTETDEIAIEDGNEGALSNGDHAIIQLEMSGLMGFFADNSGVREDDVAADFLELNRNTTGFSFIVEQTNPTANQDPKELELDDQNTTVVADDGEDVLYVIVDTTDVTASNGELETGDSYEAELELDEDTFLELYYRSDDIDDNESISGEFDFVERDAVFDTEDGEVLVENTETSEVTGETNVAPGTELTLRATRSGEGAFLRTADAEVQEDGTFTGTFEGDDSFQDIEPDTTFEMEIRQQSFDDDAETDARVVESMAEETPTPTEETPTPTEAEETPTEAEETPTEAEETPTEEPADDQAGFGAVVALIALLGAALLAARRNAF